MQHQVFRVVSRLAVDIGSPRALAVKMLIDAEEWAELQRLKCKPSDYFDSETYWKDCLITDILRKCDLPSGIDKEAVAIETFFSCERQCAATNARLSRFLDQHLLIETPEEARLLEFIRAWRKEVNDVLGNLPDGLTPRFSGGATVSDPRIKSTIPDKMSSTPTWYAGMQWIKPLWEETSWARCLWSSRPYCAVPRVVRGNRFFTVAKDGLTNRGCATEASIAVAYQLAAGSVMKSRMKRIGLDLQGASDGKTIPLQIRHRRLAQKGSLDGSIATLDQSNASNTVSRVLVQLILRSDWYELLDSLRAQFCEVQKRWYRLEMFSSMGNGFTFELETLLFATLARTIVRQEKGNPNLVSCYGDDLIVPAANYKSVVAALSYFGFTPNLKKTFAEGPFRESCGGDYFDGVPVRAHFIKELPDEPQQWIALANGLRRVAQADDGNVSRWNIVRRSWLLCLDCIPGNIRRCRGPISFGDLVIHDKQEYWSVRKPKASSRNQWHSTWDVREILTYSPIPIVLDWTHWVADVQLASCTLGVPSEGITPRDGVSGYRLKWLTLDGLNWTPSQSIRKPVLLDHHHDDESFSSFAGALTEMFSVEYTPREFARSS